MLKDRIEYAKRKFEEVAYNSDTTEEYRAEIRYLIATDEDIYDAVVQSFFKNYVIDIQHHESENEEFIECQNEYLEGNWC